MTERQKERLVWGGAIVVVILILLWLWRRAHTTVAPVTATDASGNPVTFVPPPVVTGGNGQQTPTVLGLPAPQISLSFENPFGAFTNQATGYVPLYGFLSYAGI